MTTDVTDTDFSTAVKHTTSVRSVRSVHRDVTHTIFSTVVKHRMSVKNVTVTVTVTDYLCLRDVNATETPTIIDPSATKKYPSSTGSIIVGISVLTSGLLSNTW